MGISEIGYQIGSSTTHPAMASEAPRLLLFSRPTHDGKRGYHCIANTGGVVEAGVSESLPRLRQDASWWLANSAGMVRIVILLPVRKSAKRLVIEGWQLAPPGTPSLS